MLLSRDYCVGGIARILEISEAAVSQHLKVLKDVGLVVGSKRGYFMHYQVEQSVLNSLATALQELTEQEQDITGGCKPRASDNCVLCHPERAEI